MDTLATGIAPMAAMAPIIAIVGQRPKENGTVASTAKAPASMSGHRFQHCRGGTRDLRLQAQPAPEEQTMIGVPLTMFAPAGSNLREINARNRLHRRPRRN